MKPLKRMRYNTMNSWNQSTAPAYNLKVYHVISADLQDKVFDLMEADGFYDEINELIAAFGREHNYEWQAGFNGRSGGYLVLYRGGQKPSGHKSHCTACGQRSFQAVPEGEIGVCGRCHAQARVNDTTTHVETFTYPGRNIEDGEVPGPVLRAFRKLATDIVKHVESMARNCDVREEEYTVTRRRKVIE